MIIRNGIVNRVVRYNGWPVQIRNRYNNVGYIPVMTSANTPAPYVASSFGSASGSAHAAFDNDESVGSYIGINCSTRYPLTYVQIALDRPISIWKIRVYSLRASFNESGNIFDFYVSDGDDNKICDLSKGSFNAYTNNIVTLSTPTVKSQYYRVAIKKTGQYDFTQRIYTFQIYPFD